jgi:hypothetical protein
MLANTGKEEAVSTVLAGMGTGGGWGVEPTATTKLCLHCILMISRLKYEKLLNRGLNTLSELTNSTHYNRTL